MIENGLKIPMEYTFKKSTCWKKFQKIWYLIFMIEGGNIEYGNIKKCNIDTILTSRIWRLVTSKR